MYGNAAVRKFCSTIQVVDQESLIDLIKEGQVVTGKPARKFMHQRRTIRLGWNGFQLERMEGIEAEPLDDVSVQRLIKQGLFTEQV